MKSADLPPWPAGSPPDPAFCGAAERSEILAAYGIEALQDDPELTTIVKFAAHLCGTEAALISWVERDVQRFIAREGVGPKESPIEISLSAQAMMSPGVEVVPDASQDPRFADNPLVAGPEQVRFYAAQPLISGEGAPLGALCVVGREPRPAGLNELQREGLRVLADGVMQRLRTRRIALAARRELDASEAYLRTLVDSIPAIAWSATPEGHFDYFNQRMVDFTGSTDDQTGSAFHPDDWEKASRRWQRSLETGETYEMQHRLRRHDGAYRWMIARAVPVRDADGKILRWFGTAVDIHDLYEVSEARDLLARELSHRIKNIFAVMAGLVSLTVRKYPDAKGFADDLAATIRALGRAHDFVRPVGRATRGHLHGLLEELFAPYGSGDSARIKVTGGDLTINPRTATPLALVFHELATNSAKYGALATAEGTVALQIADKDEAVRLIWREEGGKAPKKVLKEGFGSRLVEMSVTGQLGGSWERRFDDGGLVVELTLPKATLAG